MGTTDNHAARCKAKCIHLGDKCTGFLHVTNYIAPGQNKNPDKGQCFFKTGYVSVPTPKNLFKRLGKGADGEVFNSDHPNEVGCLRGRLVSFNCQCAGPFVYEASITQETSTSFRSGTCKSPYIDLHSKAEPNFKQVKDWLDICVFKKVKLKRPAKGQICTKVLEDGLKEEALQQEMQDAEFQLKKDAKVLHDVRYKLKNAPSTMKASERSKLVLHVKLLSSQHEQQKRRIESLQQQILVLQIGNSGSIGTSQLRVAKDRLDKAVVDVQMKKAAFKVAQSAARANPNDDKVRAEALKIEGLLLRAKSQELNAEKHIAWV